MINSLKYDQVDPTIINIFEKIAKLKQEKEE